MEQSDVIIWCPSCELSLDPIQANNKLLFSCPHNQFQLIFTEKEETLDVSIIPD